MHGFFDYVHCFRMKTECSQNYMKYDLRIDIFTQILCRFTCVFYFNLYTYRQYY